MVTASSPAKLRRAHSLVSLADAWSAQSLDATSAAPPGFGRSTLLAERATEAARRKENIMGPNFNAGFVQNPPRNPSWSERSQPRNPLRFYIDQLPVVAMARREGARLRGRSHQPQARRSEDFYVHSGPEQRRPSHLAAQRTW